MSALREYLQSDGRRLTGSLADLIAELDRLERNQWPAGDRPDPIKCYDNRQYMVQVWGSPDSVDAVAEAYKKAALYDPLRGHHSDARAELGKLHAKLRGIRDKLIAELGPFSTRALAEPEKALHRLLAWLGEGDGSPGKWADQVKADLAPSPDLKEVLSESLDRHAYRVAHVDEPGMLTDERIRELAQLVERWNRKAPGSDAYRDLYAALGELKRWRAADYATQVPLDATQTPVDATDGYATPDEPARESGSAQDATRAAEPMQATRADLDEIRRLTHDLKAAGLDKITLPIEQVECVLSLIPPPRPKLTGDELWEILYSALKGNVPDGLDKEALNAAAKHILDVFIPPVATRESYVAVLHGLSDDHGVVVGGQFDGWLVWKHPDGQWVTQHKLERVEPIAWPI